MADDLDSDDPAWPVDLYQRLGADGWSDATLLSHVAAVVCQPVAAAPTSFILHAPLELLARARLLPKVGAAHRRAARLRVLAVAAQLSAAGEFVAEPPRTGLDELPEAELVAQLLAALQEGDVDQTDRCVVAAGRRIDPRSMVRHTLDAIAASTAAAGHAPIYHHLATHPGLELSPGPLLRPLARSLAQSPDWVIRWVEDRPAVDPTADLYEALAQTPLLGPGPSTSIQPTMSRVDPAPAADLVGPALGASIDQLGRHLARVAAGSMCQEPPTHAPYGWSHCLTMPFALVACSQMSSDPHRLMAIAATHVVGFRASLATGPLDPDWSPEPIEMGWREALDSSATEAAAAVWSTEEADEEITQELVDRAAAAHDAHHTKYVVTCLDAMALDPEARRLYLAAAAQLSGYWAEKLGTSGQ